jgi:hypothetical protein
MKFSVRPKRQIAALIKNIRQIIRLLQATV